jgi:hypothetical protein
MCGVWFVRGRLGVGDANSSAVSSVPEALGGLAKILNQHRWIEKTRVMSYRKRVMFGL